MRGRMQGGSKTKPGVCGFNGKRKGATCFMKIRGVYYTCKVLMPPDRFSRQKKSCTLHGSANYRFEVTKLRAVRLVRAIESKGYCTTVCYHCIEAMLFRTVSTRSPYLCASKLGHSRPRVSRSSPCFRHLVALLAST